MYLLLKSFFLSFSILLILPAPLSAQTSISKSSHAAKLEFKPYSPLAVTRLLASQFGIKEGSPFYSRLSAKLAKHLSNPDSQQTLAGTETSQVVKHYRFDEGILLPVDYSYLSLLPTKEEFLQKHDPNALNNPKHKMAAQSRKRGTESLLTPPKLPACKSSNTITKPNHDNSISHNEDEIVIFDMLILKNSAPQNLESASSDFADTFGAETKVRHYSTQLGDIIALEASKNGVTCLPFRIRVTDKFKYHDTGINAIKNYDGNQSGKGILHHIIRKELYSFL